MEEFIMLLYNGFLMVIRVIGTIVFLLAIIGYLLKLSNKFLPKYFCTHAQWHLPPIQQTYEYGVFKGKCPRCGKKVFRDAKLDWN